MKQLIVLSVVIFAASALPLDVASQAANVSSTRDPYFGLLGWATIDGGMRGGAGGAEWTVWDSWALRDAISGDQSRVVTIRGRIDLTQLFTASPGVRLRVGSYKTIRGGDRNAEIHGGGLILSNGQQIIIEDIKFNNALTYAPGEQPDGQGGIVNQQTGPYSTVDAVEITNTHHVWINHCEFSDDPWNSASIPDNRRRHDGLLDIVRGADLVSVSNNIFRNHNFVTLIGNTDNNGFGDQGRLRVTFYNNWWQGTTQRNPRVRWGRIHILNNLYTGIRSYGIGLGAQCSIYLERNVFRNTRRSWGWAAGSATNAALLNVNNQLVSSSHDRSIPNNLDWRPNQFYQYTPISDPETHVRRYAGVR